jgi:hypothetical protein
MFLTCWKWFKGVLRAAKMQVTDANKGQGDEFNYKYIGEKLSISLCSADWKKARKEINESPQMKQELIQKLEALV